MTTYLLALDQGTTSSRAVLFERDGRIAAVGQRELTQLFPRPGWVEHDPEEIWESQAATMQEAMASAGAAAADVAAVGITNQRETAIVWERDTGRPVHHAIVWQDRRTAGACDRLRRDGREDLIRERTGLVLDAYFSATKIAWLLANVEGARARAEAGELAFGTVDSWLVWKLTGGAVHATDAGNASRTLLYDIRRGDWDDELLALFGVPRAMMPEVRPSAAVYGRIDAGLPAAGAPIAGIAGDQQAATLGNSCVRPGLAKCTYGTGCFLLSNTGHEARPSANGLLTTVGWRLGDAVTYCLEGSVFIGGATVQWLRDGLGIIERAADVESLAGSVPDAGGVILVPALAGLGAPHWDPYARGLIAGITRGTTAAHLARAALEGIAFQVVDLVQAMEADAGTRLDELRVDGGAAANDLLLQTQADLLQRPIVRPRVLETTALGAAGLAGLATGVYTSVDDLATLVRAERVFEPAVSAASAAERLGRWREGVARARGWEPKDSVG